MAKKTNNLWFKDINDDILLVNENAMRARAGFLILMPIFLAFTFFDFNSMFTSQWIVNAVTASADMMDTDSANRQIYMVEAVKRTYDYTLQTSVLSFGLFELLSGVTPFTSKFSPTIRLATWIVRNKKPVYSAYTPKRFAWVVGGLLVTSCIVFFNSVLIPIPVALGLLATCLTFIWLELSFGFCMGCYVYYILVKVGFLKEECYECNNLDFSKKD